MRFLKIFGIWALCTSIFPLIVCLTGSAGAVVLLLPFLLIPALGTFILWLLNLCGDVGHGEAALVAALVGFMLPTIATIFLYADYHGFESAPTVLIGVVTAVASAIGGGWAGWIGFRHDIAVR